MNIADILDIMIDKLKRSKKIEEKKTERVPLRINPPRKDIEPLPEKNKDNHKDDKRVIIIDI